MRYHLAFAALLVVIWSTAANADVDGIWVTEKSDAGGWLHVEIRSCGEHYCGTVKSAHGPGDHTSVGIQMIKDMVADGADGFADGQIYAPDTKKWYASKMVLDGHTLKVSGCVLGGLICRSQVWKRAPTD